MRRASGTWRGSAVRMPGTSFQSTARFALSARAMSVAVRSEPPRPRVATLPSGARPMKPGTTGMVPFRRSGLSRATASLELSAMRGAAPPWCSSVRTTSRASTKEAARPAAVMAAARMVAESCSPRATSASRVRGRGGAGRLRRGTGRDTRRWRRRWRARRPSGPGPGQGPFSLPCDGAPGTARRSGPPPRAGRTRRVRRPRGAGR